MLVTLLALSLNKKEKVGEVVKSVTDTLIVEKTDTVFKEKPIYKDRIVKDTIYIAVGGTSVTLEIAQKWYSENGLYDVWVSGYETNLDSIRVYPKTIYSTITKETIIEKEYKHWNLYTYLGINRFSNAWNPNVGIQIQSPRNMMYGLEIGAYKNDRLYIGGKIGYKIK